MDHTTAPCVGIPPVAREVDQAAIARAVGIILEAIGEDPTREGLRDTPRRIAEMYTELFSGLRVDPRAHLQVGFDEEHQEMIVLRDIPFTSICEHHFLPFYGHAHVAYIPAKGIVGVSKLARLVEDYARRPQLQERLTSQVADALVEVLQPAGVGVVVEAQHMCMTVRGVRKAGSTMVTSATRGAFRAHQATRLEFLALIGKA